MPPKPEVSRTRAWRKPEQHPVSERLAVCTTRSNRLSTEFVREPLGFGYTDLKSGPRSLSPRAAQLPNSEECTITKMRVLSILCVLASSAATPPKLGVKTPGVQIPFASLKPELVYKTTAHPSWIAFSDSAFVPGADGLQRIDPKDKEAKFLPPIAGPKALCGGVVRAFGSLWTSGCGDGHLIQIDAKAGKATAEYAFGAGPLAASDDSIWLMGDSKSTLYRIDPRQHQIVADLRLPVGCRSLVFGEASLWAACPEQNQVARINPMTNLVEKWIAVSAEPRALAIGEGSVWVLCRKDGKVERIDPKTNKVAKTIDVGVPGADGVIAVGEGSVWVTLAGFPLTRISPQSEQVVQQFFGAGGGAIATGGGFVWLVNTGDGSVLKIDPRRVAATLAE
jgi:virginiamycin B lyase